MVVRHDITVLRVDDHAGTGALELAFTRLRIGRHFKKTTEIRIFHQRVTLHLLLDRATGCDVDDRRRDALYHWRERGHRRSLRCGRGWRSMGWRICDRQEEQYGCHDGRE